MKAIFLIKYGDAKQSFEIRDIQPVPPKPDEVMIKVKYSGLNFADVIAREDFIRCARQSGFAWL